MRVHTLSLGNYDEAERLIREAISYEEQLGGATPALAVRYGMASDILLKKGKTDEAISFAERELKLDEEAGRTVQAAIRKSQLAEGYIETGRMEEAEKLLSEAIPIFQATNNLHSLSVCKHQLGIIQAKKGDFNASAHSLREASGTSYEKIYPVTLLFQSGYLTIDSYDVDHDEYKLRYPNKEVESGFVKSPREFYTPMLADTQRFSINLFNEDILSGNAAMFMTRLQAFYADIPYEVQPTVEANFQNTMLILCKLMGQTIDMERHTSNGRIDVLIQTDKYIYIIEMKRDKDPDNALDQIDDKGYDWPFSAGERKVFRIGAEFSTKNRRLERWSIS